MTALLIAAALVFTSGDAHLAFETARTLVDSHTPRNSGTVASARAAKYLAAASTAVGAKAHLDAFKAKSVDAEREFANVVAEISQGQPDGEWYVLVSHFDTKHGIGCPGANDGAATAGLLVGLAQAWKRSAVKGNLLLIWTDGEECVKQYGPHDGLQGSKRAAEMLAKSGKKVKSVIVADMLGDADLQISLPLNGSANLHRQAVAAAARIGEPQLVRTVYGLVTDDHVPFLERGFKAIDLIDFSYGPDNSYWHTPKDTMDKISEASLLKSGQLIVEMMK